MTQTLGVLGGMGPVATVDFLRKLISLTDAGCDQGNVPVVVRSDPRRPDRFAAIEGRGPSPDTFRPGVTLNDSNRSLAYTALRHIGRTAIKQSET
jgi:aspartate/glutamate racemase